MCMCVSNFGSLPAFDRRVLRSADGFVAFTADALCSWDPSSQRPPSSITMNGSPLQKGTLEPAPLQPLPAQTNAVPRPDLWGKLAQAKRGWVRVDQFAKVFKVSPVHDPKKATQKLLSKLYKRGARARKRRHFVHERTRWATCEGCSHERPAASLRHGLSKTKQNTREAVTCEGITANPPEKKLPGVSSMPNSTKRLGKFFLGRLGQPPIHKKDCPSHHFPFSNMRSAIISNSPPMSQWTSQVITHPIANASRALRNSWWICG